MHDETAQSRVAIKSKPATSAPDYRSALTYFLLPFAFLLAAQRAFISCESLLRPAAVIPPLRFPLFFAAFAPPPRALTRAHLARAAAAIFALAAADIRRRPPPRVAAVAPPPPLPPTNPLSRLSKASIWRRIVNACCKFRVDKSIDVFDRVKFFLMQEIVRVVCAGS
jgi:hypothetical protein